MSSEEYPSGFEKLVFGSPEYWKVLENHRQRALNNLLIWDKATPVFQGFHTSDDSATVAALISIVYNCSQLLGRRENGGQ